jgi:transmembrane sensor
MHMSAGSENQTCTPDDAACAEAAAWIARLHSSRRNEQLEAGFRRWLGESAEHRTAFEYANEMWMSAESVSKSEVPLHSLVGRTSALRAAAAVCGLLLTVAVGFVYRNYAASVYATEVGEQRALTLADGTRLTLNTNTRIRVRYRESERRIDLMQGEALFEVARDPLRPLVVHTAERLITALGTAFLVRRDMGVTSVMLIEGQVRVSDGDPSRAPSARQATTLSSSPAVLLEPGQRLMVKANEQATLDTPELNHLTAWQRGQIILDHTSLVDAIAEMNRYSETQIECGEGNDRVGVSACPDVYVTGIFRAGDTEAFGQALAASHDLQFRKHGRRIVLSLRTADR